MGGMCCCPGREDFDELTSFPCGLSLYERCYCLRCCVRWCMRTYGSWFDPGEGRDSSPPSQGNAPAAAGLLGTTSLDSFFPDTFRAPPRPLPYDVDPRYLRTPRDGLVSRRDKSGMSHLHGVEAEPLRRSSSTGDGGGGEALTPLRGVRGPVDFDELPQTYRPESPGKHQPSKLMRRTDSLGNLDPEDDICPTCLEGYDKENPKIITDCGHHFHLACIYEWAERSKHCPVCGQEMHFNEYSENV